MSDLATAPQALTRLIQDVFMPAGLIASNLKKDPDPNAKEYEAYSLKLNNANVQFRIGKDTQARPGRFVTIQKKSEKYRPGKIKSKNTPFTTDDPLDYLIVWVTESKTKSGFFVFDKMTLINSKILADTRMKGKLSFRVFFPWETELSLSANSTQAWQAKCYVSMSNSVQAIELAKELFRDAI
jgi:hypothetical protein